MWKYISAATQAVGSAPMFTWRQKETRIELSGATFLNAVSKAANFLVDGLEVEINEPVYIDLGNHWQSPVWQCAVLASGALLSDKPANLNIVNSAGIDGIENKIAVVSQDPFGMPDRNLPTEVINASAEVRGFADYFAPRTATSDQTLLTTGGLNILQARELVTNFAAEHSIAQGQAIALTQPPNNRLAIEWQCLFSVLNRSPILLLAGEFIREKVQQEERIKHFIDPY